LLKTHINRAIIKFVFGRSGKKLNLREQNAVGFLSVWEAPGIRKKKLTSGEATFSMSGRWQAINSR